MKRLSIELILPLTILSMFIFTKWWFVLPVDAPNQVMHGFPLIFVSPGFHTSMSLQFFMMEFFIDFLVYFLFWWIIVYEVRRLRLFFMNKYATILIWLATGLALCFFMLVLNISQPHFHAKRYFDIKVLDEGYHFFWERRERPELDDYDYNND